MSGLLFHIVLVGVGLVYGLLIGSLIGQQQERRWQIQKRKINADIRRAQREVDEICEAYKTPSLQWYDDNHIN